MLVPVFGGKADNRARGLRLFPVAGEWDLALGSLNGILHG
jgi:hypothetical protein